MSSLALNTGLKALLAAQSKLETVGHNVSNATTPGYSRQTLELSASPTMRLHGLIQGTGVQAQVVRRTVDMLLQARLVMQSSTVSRLDARAGALADAESLFASGTGGLDQLFKNFFASLSKLSTTPEDELLASNAVQSAADVGAKFNTLASGAKNIGIDAIGRARAQVGLVNELAERISRLNAQIRENEPGAGPANDLRDARDQALSELAKLVDVRTVEDAGGAVRVVVGGQTLVSPVGFRELELVTNGQDQLSVRVEGAAADVAIAGGSLGGLLGILEDFLPGLKQDADRLAREFILEMNRAHSTGMPASGPLRSLTGASALADQDGDGQVADELLSAAGLPFDVAAGELFVNVTDLATGALTKHRIAIDPAAMTVQDLLDGLSAIPSLAATVDAQGRVHVSADDGYAFDFSARLDGLPDDAGSFGGGRASLASPNAGPYALAAGDTLDFTGLQGSFSVTLPSQQFQSMAQATASELALVLNADAGFQANGLVASSVGGTLVVQTQGAGVLETFTFDGGTAAAALGWSAGTTVQGAALGVDPRITGAYTGAANDAWTFRPRSDGTIGTTAGLVVDVFDASGARIAQLDVGAGYVPGTELEIRDGVKVSFELGDVSATDNDLFRVDVLADSDTADLLPALGLGTLFQGHDAATIAVRAEILDSPELFATSATGAAGDAGTVLAMLEKGSAAIGGLGNATFETGVANVAGGIALELSSARDAVEAEELLRQSLEARRDQVSGVNVDEELARMIEAQQAYSAAGEYLRVVNELTSELLNIL